MYLFALCSLHRRTLFLLCTTFCWLQLCPYRRLPPKAFGATLTSVRLETNPTFTSSCWNSFVLLFSHGPFPSISPSCHLKGCSSLRHSAMLYGYSSYCNKLPETIRKITYNHWYLIKNTRGTALINLNHCQDAHGKQHRPASPQEGQPASLGI